jgi:L-methionine (R)-S-oxide reductase
LQFKSSTHKFSHHEILQELEGLRTGRWITDLANTSALLMSRFEDINWVGFYLVDDHEPSILWLGPFQGQPACTMIPFEKGVCGAAARNKKTMRIKNVDEFPGHIVCDSRSKSEVVVPIIVNDKLLGVLDVDSASLNRFSAEDQIFFENVVKTLITGLA